MVFSHGQQNTVPLPDIKENRLEKALVLPALKIGAAVRSSTRGRIPAGSRLPAGLGICGIICGSCRIICGSCRMIRSSPAACKQDH